jgi:hypothetical protein
MLTRILLALTLAAAANAQMLKMGEASEGFQLLFDGRDLGKWDGDPRLWKVDGGVIVGSTDGVEPLKGNTFLIYRGERFKDFELRLEMKLRNHNSGVQFRSEALDGWVVKGLQADAAQNAWWGSIYDEKGTRGVIVNGWKGKGETVVRASDWNDYWIQCKGEDIRVTLNGMVTSELHGETPKDGVIALQLHAGPAMRVEVKNIRVRKMD